MAILLCGACSEDNPCKSVPVCTVLPLAQENAALGTTSMMALPNDISDSSLVENNCEYHSGPVIDAKFQRLCYQTASIAASIYQGRHDTPANPGETRMDVAGVGDHAYVSTQIGMNLVELRVVKGNVVLSMADNGVMSGQEGMAQQGLMALANLLLAVN